MKTTPRNKGLTLTLKVTAYDAGRGWLGAAHVITTTLKEFHQQSEPRKKQAERTQG